MSYLLPQTIDVAAQVRPEHIAFRCDVDSISYGDLSLETNRLAHALIENGVRRGDRVGVLMPRCIESAVAVHGIMKAGAAFVPLDPHSPPAVLGDLIGFCGIKVIVVFSQKKQRLTKLVEGTHLDTVIGCEALSSSCRWLTWDDVSAFPAHCPEPSVLEHDLAYVMFTSGSTGKPKGIMHTHHSGLSYARLSVETYGVQPDDVIGSHSPLHFDMSTFGYFSGPLARATVSLIPEAYTRLPASLSQLMESHRISIWYSVPFALIQLHLRGALDDRDMSALRWVLYGGEPFTPKHLYELMTRWPHARFSNVYGPAEVNQCTYYHLPSIAAYSGGEIASVPIGVTWPNTRGFVIDENDLPVEMGEVGELVIRSSTMMQGYWGREDLDEVAFLKREGPSGLGEKYYRTGDLVRVDENGQYVFLGRKDRQVKVRGYRVELDSVEQAVSTHPAVEEVGAFVARDGSGEVMTIHAATTLRTDATAQSSELIAHSSELLPWYAVPAEIHVLADLPRTTSGKIDRRSLAAKFST